MEHDSKSYICYYFQEQKRCAADSLSKEFLCFFFYLFHFDIIWEELDSLWQVAGLNLIWHQYGFLTLDAIVISENVTTLYFVMEPKTIYCLVRLQVMYKYGLEY